MGEKGKIRLTGLVTGFVNGLFGSGGGGACHGAVPPCGNT